ncbi:MAG: glycosyltransferase family 2 protein [Pseudomonadota bacterium]
MSHTPGALARYKLRLRRKRLLWRAFRKRGEIRAVSRKTGSITPTDILLFATIRNEMQRLPHFLSHYRQLGVGHFLIVDNASEDGGDSYIAAQPDVSVWQTSASYKASRFGMDWLTCLLWRYGRNRWVVTVDADEVLIYPDWEKRDLHDLTRALDLAGLDAMGATMLDLYPKGPIDDQTYTPGQDPVETLPWFDAHGYRVQRQPKMGNLWLQGGPRARVFFADDPRRAPTLNKIPLVRWHRSFVYVNSTHNALPARLNRVYDEGGCEKPWGALLHTKFLLDAGARARREKARGEHFADPTLYEAYYDSVAANPDLWCPESMRFESAAQLERLGLIQRGNLRFDL